MPQQDFDASTELGRFLGSFLATLANEAINRIFGRANRDNREIVASLRDLEPVIDGIDHFKRIHNFLQVFLDRVSRELFIKDASSGSFLSDPHEIAEAWNRFYKGSYEKDVLAYEAYIEGFGGQAEEPHGENAGAELPRGLTNATKQALVRLASNAPMAYQKSAEFMSLLKETASVAMNKEIKAVDTSKWEQGKIKSQLDVHAKATLAYADDILVSLIQVLDELYKRMVSSADE